MDRKLQRDLIKCCREDVLFFFKGFVDLFEPRLGDDDGNQPQVVPFIPWPHQVDAIEYAAEWMGKRDIRVNKSRAQGASYLYSMMFLHRWRFHPMFKVNIVSKDQDAADNPKDPDSILGMILFALESLPVRATGRKSLTQLDLLQNDKVETIMILPSHDSVSPAHRFSREDRIMGGKIMGSERKGPREAHFAALEDLRQYSIGLADLSRSSRVTRVVAKVADPRPGAGGVSRRRNPRYR